MHPTCPACDEPAEFKVGDRDPVCRHHLTHDVLAAFGVDQAEKWATNAEGCDALTVQRTPGPAPVETEAVTE